MSASWDGDSVEDAVDSVGFWVSGGAEDSAGSVVSAGEGASVGTVDSAGAEVPAGTEVSVGAVAAEEAEDAVSDGPVCDRVVSGEEATEQLQSSSARIKAGMIFFTAKASFRMQYSMYGIRCQGTRRRQKNPPGGPPGGKSLTEYGR